MLTVKEYIVIGILLASLAIVTFFQNSIKTQESPNRSFRKNRFVVFTLFFLISSYALYLNFLKIEILLLLGFLFLVTLIGALNEN